VKPLHHFFSKLVGNDSADAVLDSTQKAINGVAIGVMGTAVLEALVAWVGFRIAGIDLATGLAAIVFLFAVVQVGPVVVMIPLIIWSFSQGDTGWGIFFIVWTVLLAVVDNVVKPLLIGRSGKMPILVLFLGVIGGMAAWGFTGMFKGAIVLAISYTIFMNWTRKDAPSMP
jgi:predicted PurR-regulated permease PerM